jgi:PAS domain S-box-containing protein
MDAIPTARSGAMPGIGGIRRIATDLARDARDLRYIFVNKAAEKLFGLPQAEIIGRSARDLFPVETAELIEQQDRQLLAGNQDIEVAARTVGTPNTGQRTVAVRRLRIAGQVGESQIFLRMIEDRAASAAAAVAAIAILLFPVSSSIAS